MAARVAAQLSKENDCQVKTSSGGFGELSVSIDGEKVVDTNRLWYPLPKNVVAKTRAQLSQKTPITQK